jgi:hypothetical protein
MSQLVETKRDKTPLKPTIEAPKRAHDNHPMTRANDPVPNLEGIYIIRRSRRRVSFPKRTQEKAQTPLAESDHKHSEKRFQT